MTTKPDLKAAEKVGRLISEALKLAPKAGLFLEIKIRPATKAPSSP